jgi:hypothetical protein
MKVFLSAMGVSSVRGPLSGCLLPEPVEA